MGLVVSSDELQKKLDAVYYGKPDVTGILDGMIITVKSEEEHDLNKLSCRSQKNNHLRLNGEKLQFKLKEVLFFGHRWFRDRLGPDPKRLRHLSRCKCQRTSVTFGSLW